MAKKAETAEKVEKTEIAEKTEAAGPLLKPLEGPQSPLWTSYVLSLLTEDELVEGKFPTTDGLRRVFEQLLGPIISAIPTVCEAPNIGNAGRATVTMTIRYLNNKEQVIEIGDAADCCSLNTEAPYSQHPAATAVTRAEGRCYRKALRLQKVLTADEKGNSNVDEVKFEQATQTLPITNIQKNTIVAMCARNSIDLQKFLSLNELGTSLDAITYTNAQSLLRMLSSYNCGPDNKNGSKIPEEIKIK